MKVLLQNLATLSYLRGEGSWTWEPEDAIDFQEVLFAVDYALDRSLEQVRPVLCFGDSRPDLALPAVGTMAYRPAAVRG